MKKFIKPVVNDKIILISTLISIIFLLVSVGCIAFYFSSLPIYVPLFHQVRWGIERLGEKTELFLPSAYVGVVVVVNLLFAMLTYEKMPLVSRIIAITNLLLTIILFMFTIRTIQLVL